MKRKYQLLGIFVLIIILAYLVLFPIMPSHEIMTSDGNIYINRSGDTTFKMFTGYEINNTIYQNNGQYHIIEDLNYFEYAVFANSSNEDIRWGQILFTFSIERENNGMWLIMGETIGSINTNTFDGETTDLWTSDLLNNLSSPINLSPEPGYYSHRDNEHEYIGYYPPGTLRNYKGEGIIRGLATLVSFERENMHTEDNYRVKIHIDGYVTKGKAYPERQKLFDIDEYVYIKLG